MKKEKDKKKTINVSGSMKIEEENNYCIWKHEAEEEIVKRSRYPWQSG